MKTTKLTIITLTLILLGSFTLPAEASFAATSKPGTAKITSAKPSGHSVVVLKWKRAKNATGYQIFRNGKAIKKAGKNATSYKVTGLKPDTKYTFKLRAYTTYKEKQWFNKKTRKWQNKRPVKKYRGKTRIVKATKYGKYSSTKNVKIPPIVVEENIRIRNGAEPYSTIYKGRAWTIEFVKPAPGTLTYESSNRKAVGIWPSQENPKAICLSATGEYGISEITVRYTPAKGYVCNVEKTFKFTVTNTVFPTNEDGSYTIVADWENCLGTEPTTVGGVWREFTSAIHELPDHAVIRVNVENMDRSKWDYTGWSKGRGWGIGSFLETSNPNVVFLTEHGDIIFVGPGEADLVIDYTWESTKTIHVIAE